MKTVSLYQPLLFPLALQLGGFFFLAYGLAPRREPAIERPVVAEAAVTKKRATRMPATVNAKPVSKKRKALPQPTLPLPAGSVHFDPGSVHFDRRAAMRAE